MKDKYIGDYTICRGVTKAARQVGVSYTHLWRVLAGKADSPSLVLKIRDRVPTLFKTKLCSIDYAKIIGEAQKKYVWDKDTERYRIKKEYDKRSNR